MADVSSDDRTEEATPERREEFRERGQVVVSRELTSVTVLFAIVIFFTYWAGTFTEHFERILTTHFEQLSTRKLDATGFLEFATASWREMLVAILPLAVVSVTVAAAITLLQTRFNWSWQKLSPDFSRLNPLTGLTRMVNSHAWIEVFKSCAKLAAISIVAYLIIFSEVMRSPAMMNWPILATLKKWGDVTQTLFWSVCGLLTLVAGADYFFNFMSVEKQIKMTKQEVREDYRRREGDPHLKGRMKRMARDIVLRKTVAKTREATVLITNPTHYSIALRYEPGESAPVLVAKGIDFIALKMREVAREEKIPIIENRPLARALYAQVEEGQEVPEKFYKAVAEIIRYVFKLKGRRIPARKKPVTASRPAPEANT